MSKTTYFPMGTKLRVEVAIKDISFEDRLQMFADLAQDLGIIDHMVTQGTDGTLQEAINTTISIHKKSKLASKKRG